MSLFKDNILNEKIKNQNKNILQERWSKFNLFQKKIEDIKKLDEQTYQDGFIRDIFESCLGYTLNITNPKSFNLVREQKNQSNSQKADGAILVDNKVIGIIELKSTKTKDLEKRYGREDTTVNQAFNYLTAHDRKYCHYVIVSNFDEIRFYIDDKLNYQSYSLFNLTYEEFEEFHYLLCYENIKQNIPLQIKEQQSTHQDDISNKIYKQYSQLRVQLFNNLIEKNENIDKNILLAKTQKILDRMIFIFFAEDRGIIPSDTIDKIIEQFKNDYRHESLYSHYKIYFDAINKGNDRLNISAYNGGLFADDEILDNLIIDDFILQEIPSQLSKYNFNTEIDVNILGHIFENSLNDIEELKASINDENFDKTKTKRKKDGVFYTPEYITKYIVENTLGKLCDEKKELLGLNDINIEIPKNPAKLNKTELAIEQSLKDYREYLLSLKILDPACGSGAFLNQALNYLLKEHDFIDESEKVLLGGGGLFGEEKFAKTDVKKEVLEHNLYGVDINEEAVEIAKLSLWLRTVEVGRPLTRLADKLKVGNSLIDDKSVVNNAFEWEKEFPEVFAQGGFDVVIGNPPYITFALGKKQEFESNDIKYYKDNFPLSSVYKVSSYLIFIEKSLKLISNKGLLSFIVPNTIYTNYYYSNFREHLIDNFALHTLFNLEYEVFEDADTGGSSIFIFGKDKIERTKLLLTKNENEFSLPYLFYLSQNEFKNLPDNKFLFSDSLISLWNKSFEHSIPLGSDNFKFYQGIITGDNKKFLSEQQLDDRYRPIIRGRDFYKYTPLVNEMYVLFDPEQLWSNTNEEMYLVDEKLIFRQTSDHLVVTYDNLQKFSLDSTHIFFDKSQKFNHKYLLAIINSKLLNFLYQIIVPEVGKVFSQVKGVNLKKLPIKEISLEHQEPFIQKADLMLELNKKLQETKQNFIKELNLEKITKKLQNFETLEFDEFVKEFTKAKKIKFENKLAE